MAGFDDPAFYGDRWADIYDEHFGSRDANAAVEFLAGLAGAGPVLELAIGTGRVALPLMARGIGAEGVDASAEMVQRLRAKPRGRGWVVIGSVYSTASKQGSLDEQLKGSVKTATAGWVAVVLEQAGVVMVDRARPGRIRLQPGW